MYRNLQECITDLEKNGQLVRVKEEVDPYLEMAAIHLRVFDKKGPALLFEKVKGSPFRAVSNIFGTIERSRFLFRDSINTVKKLAGFRNDTLQLLRHPGLALKARASFPKQVPFSGFEETTIDKLPQLVCWPKDGGAFVTLPLVYTEDADQPGIMRSNLGMYRIQLSGNNYILNKEVGLHYQLHRGIGVHQTKANAKGKPLKVSVFIGGPPANIFSAVMPLPEGMSELTFAGVLGGRKFRYAYHDGYCISTDADFIITGEVWPGENKPEGPFGDHFGYYSLVHDFPVMRVHKVWHRKNAIWPFTVVGRPPQEDTAFGALIHELTGDVLPNEIPGLKEVHAVDAAGVHPLLLAVGSERYTPYIKERKPQEVLTIANHILGTGQMSLAKYLFITAKEDGSPSAHDVPGYFHFLLERVDWSRDLHFQTNTTIDTLDYSGSGLNSGSKVVIAAAGEKKRELGTQTPALDLPEDFSAPRVVLPGIIAVKTKKYSNSKNASDDISRLTSRISDLTAFPLIILCDDSEFLAANINNFLWATFTRSNPSSDIYGVDSFIENKHWGCRGSLIIDARVKPYHAPVLEKDPMIEKRVDALGEKGRSLYRII
ncbi:MAG TPA: UbiD family decarboxylase [Bacteroidia bacterium]|jgi:4-hydroxy-3-polyprenylbenzoate decarboxylase